jgi:hypothetical protein
LVTAVQVLILVLQQLLKVELLLLEIFLLMAAVAEPVLEVA